MSDKPEVSNRKLGTVTFSHIYLIGDDSGKKDQKERDKNSKIGGKCFS